MESYDVPLTRSNIIVAPLSTVKSPATLIEETAPAPPGARVPARNTLPPAVIAPPALMVPPAEPRVLFENPLQVSVPPVSALSRSSDGVVPVPMIDAFPEADSAPILKAVDGVER
jgi:hypothetical protein